MTDSDELAGRADAVIDALMRNDTAALEDLYLESFLGFSVGGERENRDLILEYYQPGAVKLNNFEIEDQEVEVFGDVGIITGTAVLDGSYGDIHFAHHVCFTDIYLKKGGKWCCYRSQATEIPAAQPQS